MSNDFEKDKINIDDLVDFLVKRRDEQNAAVSSAPVQNIDEEETMPAIMPEPPAYATVSSTAFNEDMAVAIDPVVDDTTLIAVNDTVEENDLDDKVDDLIFSDSSLEVPEELEDGSDNAEETNSGEDVLSPVPPMPKKKRGIFGVFSRKKAEEEDDDDWSEWDLKPIGHYRTTETEDTVSESETPVEAEEQQPNDSETLSDDEFPAVRVAAETITMQVVLPSGEALPRRDDATRVLPLEHIAESAADWPQVQ